MREESTSNLIETTVLALDILLKYLDPYLNEGDGEHRSPAPRRFRKWLSRGPNAAERKDVLTRRVSGELDEDHLAACARESEADPQRTKAATEVIIRVTRNG